MEQDKSINVKIVSPSFDLKYDLKPKELSKLTDKLIRYSEPSKKKNTIFVWPEGVYAGYSFYEIQYLKEKFKNNFSKNHIIVFSPFEGDVERGVQCGIAVQARVRPFLNMKSLKSAGVSLKPFFLKVAKKYEK